MTKATFDLYWIAVDSNIHRNGVGRRLLVATEDEVRRTLQPPVTPLPGPQLRALEPAGPSRAVGEATRQGIDAFVHELKLVSRPWGFRLQDIRVPVTIWQGDADNSTPIGMATAMAEAIPHASLRILPGEGHLIFLTHWPEIVEDLLKERRA